ncbi:MAG: response regulator transcription factor [Acidimicrobiia bacterium]
MTPADPPPRASERITVVLADDNLIVREGVAALLRRESDLEIVGVAEDLDGLVRDALAPQVLVTGIRMPPAFQSEGIDGAKELRRRHPGTGGVVLSQYDDAEPLAPTTVKGRVAPVDAWRLGTPVGGATASEDHAHEGAPA